MQNPGCKYTLKAFKSAWYWTIKLTTQSCYSLLCKYVLRVFSVFLQDSQHVDRVLQKLSMRWHFWFFHLQNFLNNGTVPFMFWNKVNDMHIICVRNDAVTGLQKQENCLTSTLRGDKIDYFYEQKIKPQTKRLDISIGNADNSFDIWQQCKWHYSST